MLTNSLKARTTGRTWNEQDEVEFRVRLEQELDKIHDFQKEKVRAFALQQPLRRSSVVLRSDRVAANTQQIGRPWSLFLRDTYKFTGLRAFTPNS